MYKDVIYNIYLPISYINLFIVQINVQRSTTYSFCACTFAYLLQRKLILTAHAWVSGPDLAPQKFYCPNSLGTSWDAKNILKKIFILLSFWDTAVCLHFWVNFKMAARGPERVTSQVFWSFLLPKKFSAPHASL